MQSVIQFGIAAKNGEIAAQALKILRGLAPLAARAAAKQMKQNNLACEEVSEVEMEETEVKDNQKQQRIVLLRLQQVLRAKQEELIVLEN